MATDATTELQRREEADKPCWRIYWPKSAAVPDVVCMQWFDQSGYDQDRFVNSEHYPSAEAARAELWRLWSLALPR